MLRTYAYVCFYDAVYLFLLCGGKVFWDKGMFIFSFYICNIYSFRVSHVIMRVCEDVLECYL